MTKFAVVLPAGGLGKRMGASIPKQLLKIGDKAIYRYSLETFLHFEEISEVVLAVPADWKSHFEEELVAGCGIPDNELAKLKIVVGGAERWQSVRNGVEALTSDAEYVLVHDVARPFMTEALVRETFKTLIEKGSCLVAKPCADTVKVASNGQVEKTLDRKTIWLAQTPQSASIALLKKLYAKIDAEPLGFLPTDEASILEHFGEPVYIVEGNSANDKLTTKEDLEKFTSSKG